MGFSTIEVGEKHAGPSGLGDLEVPEYHTHNMLRAVGVRMFFWSICLRLRVGIEKINYS